MEDLTGARTFAVELATLGARIALGHFRKGLSPRAKADGTWVTEADWAAEAQMRLRIARAFPDHNVLGEEEGLSRAGGGEAMPGAPTWVLDPIDGTNNFVAGIPVWATLVGLRTEAGYVVGAVAAPALLETYDAASGQGARFNDGSIATDEGAALEEATVVFADVTKLGEERTELLRRARRTRGFGDFWGHMLVARGAAHVMVEPELAEWDVAALAPIVHEAGGKLTHIDGSEWAGKGSCLSTTARLHDEVVGLLTR